MHKLVAALLLFGLSFSFAEEIYLPTLKINGATNHKIAKAYRIAIGDITGNIQDHKSGYLAEESPCILAGLFYNKPWTRDAAINVWNGGGLLFPTAAKNTLMAQIDIDEEGNIIIGGQYWDKIIWGIGAWNYYLYNYDKKFLSFSYAILKNTIKIQEERELNSELNLFRGPAVYGDGVAAYPRVYTTAENSNRNGEFSGILDWIRENPKYGESAPMMTLSTNCIYAAVYKILHQMEKELDITSANNWLEKESQLKQSINTHFWNNTRYDYLIDPFGGSDYQEGLGHAFAILFGIADDAQTAQIMNTIHVEPAGIPCVYPAFPRHKKSTKSYGRHAGTVWPHVQGFWAAACRKTGNMDGFLHEFNNLTTHANRDFQFVEIYHPITGLPYGGLQEPHLAEKTEWFCAERQTWSATAYLRMILMDIIGMKFSTKGIKFTPYLPESIDSLTFGDFKYRDANISITISGQGNQIDQFTVNETETKPMINSSLNGRININIILKNE